jgi:hypothetical protein
MEYILGVAAAFTKGNFEADYDMDKVNFGI